MQIAETVNLQIIVPNAANVKAPAETNGESFTDALNSVSTATEVSSYESDMEKALGNEINEVVQKILSGKMRPESVPKKYLCFDTVKAAIKAVMKLWNMTEDEVDELLLTAVQPKNEGESACVKTENTDEKSDDNKAPIYSGISVPINFTVCAEEIAEVKGNTAAETVVIDVHDTVKATPTENVKAAPEANAARIIPTESIAIPETAQRTVTTLPTENDSITVPEAPVQAPEAGNNLTADITPEAAQTAVQQTEIPETAQTVKEEPVADNGAELVKTAPIEAVQQASAKQQSGGNESTTDFTRSSSTAEVKAQPENVKSDFNITRFETTLKPVTKTEAQQPDENGEPIVPTQNVRKPQIVRTTEIEELNVPKTTAKTESAETAVPVMTEQTLPQTVKLNIGGKEIEVRPSEVLNQVTNSITEKVQTTANRDEYVVELEPVQLGKITIRLIKESGKLSVSIMAENKQTEALLADKGQFIREAVKENGVQLESWQVVSESKQEHTAQDYNGSSKNPYYREEEAENSDNDGNDSFAELLASM